MILIKSDGVIGSEVTEFAYLTIPHINERNKSIFYILFLL